MSAPLFEIRVHGVSGTPPTSVMQVQHVVRVAGDAVAGFYQPTTTSTVHPDPQPGTVVEAYSWSGLTSGGRWRALWLLLLPFMLVNVAWYATSRPLSGPGRGRRVHGIVLRLLALSLTCTFVLGIVSISMDLVAWQYLRPGREVTQPLLKWMRWGWLDQPQRQLALTAAVPLAMAALLWWLANQTWARTERTPVPPRPADESTPARPAESAPAPAAPPAEPTTPLADRAMFNGRGPVRKLRAVHVSAAFSVVAAMLLLPEWHHPETSFWAAAGRGGLLGILTLLVLALLGVAIALTCLPSMTERSRPGAAEPTERDIYTFLPWVALALAVGCGVFVWFSGAFEEAWPGSMTSGGLTGFADVVVWLFVVQVALVIVSAVVAWLQRTASAHLTAWAGLAPAGLAATAWLVAGGFSAALMLAVARVLGSPAAEGRVNSARDLIVPTPYLWGSAVALGAGLAAIAMAGYLLWAWRAAEIRLRRTVAANYDGVARRSGEQGVAGRIRTIARQWAKASLTDTLVTAAGALLCAVLALVVAAAIGYGISHDWILDQLSWAVTLGVIAMAGLALVLLQVGRRAYSDQAERRTIGILWDLGTFWPRAVHPLAPPCYSERTIPDLLRRIRFRRREGAVVLSCHSQGTIIGAATVLQLDGADAAAAALLTYGSPLRRLYARIFPAYFGVDALCCVEQSVGARWRNLYRASDPIGGYVLADRIEQAGPSAEVDWWLLDPVFDPPDGDGSWPPTLGHSGYWADPAYALALADLAAKLPASSSRTP